MATPTAARLHRSRVLKWLLGLLGLCRKLIIRDAAVVFATAVFAAMFGPGAAATVLVLLRQLL